MFTFDNKDARISYYDILYFAVIVSSSCVLVVKTVPNYIITVSKYDALHYLYDDWDWVRLVLLPQPVTKLRAKWSYEMPNDIRCRTWDWKFGNLRKISKLTAGDWLKYIYQTFHGSPTWLDFLNYSQNTLWRIVG